MHVPEVNGMLVAVFAAAGSALVMAGALRLHARTARSDCLASAPKPRFRGVTHAGAAVAAAAAGYDLVASAPDAEARLAALLYGGAIVVMLSTSAAYHVIAWTAGPERALMRADHANIFAVIAASFTPFVLLHGSSWDSMPLRAIWLCAIAGIIAKLVVPAWPPWLSALVYAAFAWAPILVVVSVTATIGSAATALTIAAGVIYTAGSVVYAAKRLNMWPETFGFHEFWHLFVLVATGIQWWVIASVVIPRL